MGLKAAKTERATAKVAGTLAQDAMRGATTIANLLAKRLHDSIGRGDFVIGSSLPSERELMAKYSVSRATVREALRVLRTHDLIEVRRGRGGGSFICSTTPNSLVRSLNQFIQGQDFRFIDLIAAREAIETAAAAQAAISRTEETLEALRLKSVECEENVEDYDRFVKANLEWHLALAEASDNPLFVAFLTSISTAMHEATAFREFDARTRKTVAAVHRRIYEAIRDRDPDAARRRTERHLFAYSQQLATNVLTEMRGVERKK